MTEVESETGSDPRLAVRHVSLSNFRSYGEFALETDERPVVIVGRNGAGKTNLLEAISLFCPGRGLRRAAPADLPRRSGDGSWAVACSFGDGADDARLGLGAPDPARGRVVRLNGETASGVGEFADYLRLLWLTPAMDRLFVDTPGDRRRFIDRMTLTRDSAHARQSSVYEKAMRERTRLLKNGVRDAAWLSGLEAQMAESGVAVAAARNETVAALTRMLRSQVDSPFPVCDIAIDGELERALFDAAAADVEDGFLERLADGRGRDAEAGRALYGPHRSDVIAHHGATGQDARLCSTGEQKALLISLILANARLLTEDADAPTLILLLDEIAAHLDDERRGALFDALAELRLQVWMTGVETHAFAGLVGRAQFFEITDGRADALPL